MSNLVKGFLTLFGLTAVFTFTLAGFGLWKLYNLKFMIFLIISPVYITAVVITTYLAYKLLYGTRLDVNKLSVVVKELSDRIVKELEVLTANPILLIKTTITLLNEKKSSKSKESK